MLNNEYKSIFPQTASLEELMALGLEEAPYAWFVLEAYVKLGVPRVLRKETRCSVGKKSLFRQIAVAAVNHICKFHPNQMYERCVRRRLS